MQEENNKYSISRSTVCWSCSNPLESDINESCPVCGWMICPVCGSCEKYGCFSIVAKTRIAKIAYRDLYVRQNSTVDRKLRPDVRIWIKERTPRELHEAEAATIRAIKKQEEAQRELRIEAAKQKRQLQQMEQERELQQREALLEKVQLFGVHSPTRGHGDLVRFYLDGKFPMIECSFGEEKASFLFPGAFDSGFLSVDE